MKPKSKVRQYGESLVIAVVIALSVKSLVFAAYTIPSSSMEPTLLIGDYLIANRLSYVMKVPFTDIVLLTLGEPERGDIIIFRYPKDRSKNFVKRVIAKPGDVIEINNKVVHVNGQRADDAASHFLDTRVIPGTASPRDNFGPVTVPKDSYFVMGDNRDNSSDSRFWGFLKKKDLVGKAEIIYFSRDSNATSLLSYVRWHRLGHLLK
ncbi:signal peptidase I [Thermodesulfobacteriota bacterium]